jgi:hypothetical protein
MTIGHGHVRVGPPYNEPVAFPAPKEFEFAKKKE